MASIGSHQTAEHGAWNAALGYQVCQTEQELVRSHAAVLSDS